MFSLPLSLSFSLTHCSLSLSIPLYFSPSSVFLPVFGFLCYKHRQALQQMKLTVNIGTKSSLNNNRVVQFHPNCHISVLSLFYYFDTDVLADQDGCLRSSYVGEMALLPKW